MQREEKGAWTHALPIHPEEDGRMARALYVIPSFAEGRNAQWVHVE